MLSIDLAQVGIYVSLFGAAFCMSYILCSVLFNKSLEKIHKQGSDMTSARLKSMDMYMFSGEMAQKWADHTNLVCPWLSFKLDTEARNISITWDYELQQDMSAADELYDAELTKVSRRHKKLRRAHTKLQKVLAEQAQPKVISQETKTLVDHPKSQLCPCDLCVGEGYPGGRLIEQG